MLNINFRREPIYLSEEKLQKPEYISYRTSIQKLPSLKLLRDHFVGRIIHSSVDQWKQDVLDLLRFNASTMQDSLKWSKKSK